MPHMVFEECVDLERVADGLPAGVHRWGRAVLKTDQVWRRRDGQAVLVEGVVVEFARPQHPVIQIAPHHEGTIVRLWSLVPVERTPAVQRWVAMVAADLQRLGAGALLNTNIPRDLWQDLQLTD
ncbi:MAG: hypothetical protein ACC742_00120 [Thermoanaerobaculales bacterium]